MDDAIIARAFGHYEAMLGERLAQAAPALADAAAVIGAIRPRHYLSPDASRLSDWALAEACGDARVTRWVISRNTHVPATSPLAADACEGYFAARHPDGMVDRYVFWSPHGAAAARAFLPRTRWADIEAVAAIPVAQRFAVETPASAPRKVLVADSYGSWWFTHNWVFQTSDEFLEGLRSLVAVVESLPRTELLVRAKRKRELEGPDYGRLLPAHDNVTVAIRDVPFPRAVAACDLLVAFRSTTIEEAIHARKPVLLWGGTRRYRYLPARTASPSRSDRGVVYAADDADHLARLLPAILDAHAGAPLTDAEIAPHVWPAGTAEISDLARRLVEDHGHRGRGAPAAVAEPLNADA